MSNVEPVRTYTSAEDRRAQILEMVERQGFCTITELSAAFEVSDMTIRRDIRMLVDSDDLRSVHGGVTKLKQTEMMGTDFLARTTRMGAAKRAIAERALDFVPRSGAIAVDAGTTTLELATALPADSRVKVVTHSLSVVNALAGRDHIEVICLGGTLHAGTQSFAGAATVAHIGELHVRTLFLAASGLKASGVYCGNDYDAVTKRALVGATDEVVLLTDSSKFSISAMVRACELSELDRVITDDGISEEHLAMLTSHDIEVIVVPTGSA
ncbi:DeoR/GlpR family DNA-binding transcription regulator [Actinoplanes sp. NPDC051411]|uniref:DeoR/GlpR family DNA-binding transcription regulator n=1 Tax=Actinoplanes sp. NPDC051411 TaxID=3155522 RepID=UPI00342FB20E